MGAELVTSIAALVTAIGTAVAGILHAWHDRRRFKNLERE
jgi:hypothetical protein